MRKTSNHHVRAVKLNQDYDHYDGFRYGPFSYYDKLCQDENKDWQIPSINLEFPDPKLEPFRDTDPKWEKAIIIEGSGVNVSQLEKSTPNTILTDKKVKIHLSVLSKQEAQETEFDSIGKNFGSIFQATVYKDGTFSDNYLKDFIDNRFDTDNLKDIDPDRMYEIEVRQGNQCGISFLSYD